ncbi:MAG: YegS/Rv2252/BmrU family lipid kinase [Lachnospiraceae bacterium]|nr:YegS/Rv2252/BmrU family lipid kinase [Lachnospiraceae bacterium]
MEHDLLIYNPKSGRTGLKDDFLGRIVQELTENGTMVTVYQTQNKGDAKEYIKRKQIRFDKIICCGGDGTLHEVVNGIMEIEERNILAYIPSGSTNDCARNIGITKENAVYFIKRKEITIIDLGIFNGEYFNYIAAFGAFTNIPFITSQKIKNILGYFAYLLEGVKHLSDIKGKYIKVLLDDKIWIEDNIVLGMITNSFSVAGIKNRTRNITKLDDGKLEYLFVKMPENLIELQLLITSLLSEKLDEKYIYFGQVEKMHLESEEMEWTLDGENGGIHKQVEIQAVQKVLNMIVGE